MGIGHLLSFSANDGTGGHCRNDTHSIQYPSNGTAPRLRALSQAAVIEHIPTVDLKHQGVCIKDGGGRTLGLIVYKSSKQQKPERGPAKINTYMPGAAATLG